jgi:hypothetical protein
MAFTLPAHLGLEIKWYETSTTFLFFTKTPGIIHGENVRYVLINANATES